MLFRISTTSDVKVYVGQDSSKQAQRYDAITFDVISSFSFPYHFPAMYIAHTHVHRLSVEFSGTWKCNYGSDGGRPTALLDYHGRMTWALYPLLAVIVSVCLFHGCNSPPCMSMNGAAPTSTRRWMFGCDNFPFAEKLCHSSCVPTWNDASCLGQFSNHCAYCVCKRRVMSRKVGEKTHNDGSNYGSALRHRSVDCRKVWVAVLLYLTSDCHAAMNAVRRLHIQHGSHGAAAATVFQRG